MAVNRFYQTIPDCNRCEPAVKCAGMTNSAGCLNYIPPKEGWMLAEFVLAHPTSLNEALKDLPFDVSLNFYLK